MVGSSDNHGTPAPRHWDSALAASRTADKKYYITSPNCDFIPEPLVGRVVVAMRADYRYGPPDPIQWPQVLSPNFEYLCAILRRVPDSDARAPIWQDPREEDFKVIQGCEFKSLGRFTKISLKPLAKLVTAMCRRIAERPGRRSTRLTWLCAAMRQACDRLHRFPCTFRDACVQMRETQRYWLMANTFMEYADILAHTPSSTTQPVRKELMGAFSAHAHAVQHLFEAGIPVWFIRSDASVVGMHLTTVEHVQPSSICTAFGPGCGYELYTGLSGTKHLQCTARGGHTYLDISHAPLLAIYEDANYAPPAPQKSIPDKSNANATPNASTAASTTTSKRDAGPIRAKTNVESKKPTPYRIAPSHVRGGRNHFQPFWHKLMPSPISSWAEALTSMDLSKPARPCNETWGRFFPEPALLMGPQTEAKRKLYAITWLRIRPAWLYLLTTASARVTALNAQWWRNILLGPDQHTPRSNTLNAKRMEAIKRQFGHIFRDEEWNERGGWVDWDGDVINEVTDKNMPQVLWELTECSFRYDLLALDRVLVPRRTDPSYEVEREELLGRVFEDKSARAPPSIPRGPVGLAHGDIRVRRYRIEALRRVVDRWPLAGRLPAPSTEITLTTPLDIVDAIEKELISTYVHTFFAYSGRAPSIPHVAPLRATRAPRHELRIVRECATDEEISEHSSYDYDSNDYWH